MKECPACKAENTDSAKFCSACGALLEQTRVPEERPTQDSTSTNENGTVTRVEPQTQNEATVRKMFRFSSSNEKFLASIGNSFIENFLTGGKVSQTIAAVTDKRLYYHGRTLTGNGLKVSKVTEEGSVKVRDITYTGFTHSDPKWMKIVGIILSILGGYFMFSTFGMAIIESTPFGIFLILFLFSSCLLAPGVLLLRKYKQERTSIFIIRFAGGGLAFNVNLYPVEESQQFQDALNRAIDAEK